MTTTPEHSLRPHTRWRFTILFGMAGSLVVALVVLAFVWPAATADPRDLTVGIAGSQAQATQLEHAAGQQASDPFSFTPIDGRAEAVSRIESRNLFGAVVLGSKPEVLVASAAGAAPNQALRGLAAGIQAQLMAQGQSTTVTITDVVPLNADDPSGAGLNAAAFPLVMGGMLGGVLISLLVVGVVRRLVALVVFGVVAGALTTLVLQTWLGVLHRDWTTNAAAFALAMLATAAVVVGFNSLLGPPGIAVGAVLSLLVGNPISGAAIQSQFLVGPWGQIGQDFVPGAAATLVRSLSYFPDADTGRQWLVLGLWAAGGLVLSVIGHFRSRAPVPLPAGELEPA